MKEIKTSGIIIKETKVGEGNKIFTILSTDMGKIQAGGAGVRSYKSKLSSGCSLFAYSDFSLRAGRSKDIYNIVSADKKIDFFDIRYDIFKLSLANYISDIINHITVSGEDSSRIIRLFLNTMYYLQKNDCIDKIKSVFEFRVLCEAGLAPNLDSCVECGSSKNLIYFSVDKSGLECENCKKNQNIIPDTISAMRYIKDTPQKNIFSFNADEKVMHQLCLITEQYMLSHIGYMPRSLSYLKSIKVQQNT